MFPKISQRPQSGFGDYIPTFRKAGAERNRAAGRQRELASGGTSLDSFSIRTFRGAGAERNKAAGKQRERETYSASFVPCSKRESGSSSLLQEGGGEYFSAAKSNPLPPLELPSPCKRYYDASAMRLFIAPDWSLRIVSVGVIFLLNCFLLV